MEMCLNGLRLNSWATVVKIDAPEALACRLRSCGIIPGTRVCCRYRTPCGAVTALEARSSVIALRTRDMAYIRVAC